MGSTQRLAAESIVHTINARFVSILYSSMHAPHAPGVIETRARQADSLVLRDEADAALERLQQRLEVVRQRLEHEAHSANERSWQLRLAPHLAERLHAPAAALVEHLQAAAGQCADSPLRSEIQDCERRARWLADSLNQIRLRHVALGRSFGGGGTAAPEDCAAAAAENLRTHGIALRVQRQNLPQRIGFSSAACAAVLSTLVDVANGLHQRPASVEFAGLEIPASAAGTSTSFAGGASSAHTTKLQTLAGALRITIRWAEPWYPHRAADFFAASHDAGAFPATVSIHKDLPRSTTEDSVPSEMKAPHSASVGQEAPGIAAIRARLDPAVAVELVYVEKLLEARGGTLRFLSANKTQVPEALLGLELLLPQHASA